MILTRVLVVDPCGPVSSGEKGAELSANVIAILSLPAQSTPQVACGGMSERLATGANSRTPYQGRVVSVKQITSSSAFIWILLSKMPSTGIGKCHAHRFSEYSAFSRD